MHTSPLEICTGRENLHESWPCGCSPSRACHAPPSISFREALWGGPALPSLGHCAMLSGSVVSDSLQPHGLQPTRLLCLWNSLDKNNGRGSHSFLQGFFPTQGLSPGLPHYKQILYSLSHQGSPYLQCATIILKKSVTLDLKVVVVVVLMVLHIAMKDIRQVSDIQAIFN